MQTEHSILKDDPLWFKNAIIYEVPVRAFADSNGDGIGDFRGLTEKLDYLQNLGVTALWVLPFSHHPCGMMGTILPITPVLTLFMAH